MTSSSNIPDLEKQLKATISTTQANNVFTSESTDPTTLDLNMVAKLNVNPETPPTNPANPTSALDEKYPYENGYRDFAFGHIIDRNAESQNLKVADLNDHAAGSNGVVVPELGDFQRVGTFPFKNLPTEIRNRVYNCLLSPLFSYGEALNETYFYFSPQEKHISTLLTTLPHKGFERFLQTAKKRRNQRDRGIAVNSTLLVSWWEGNAIDYFDFEAFRHRECQRVRMHPGRTENYKLSPICNREIPNDDQPDYLLIEWIRQISNISSGFRKELGDALWSRSYLGVDYPDRRILCSFLSSRPAILPGIKHLRLDAQFLGGKFGVFDSYLTKDWCQFMAQHVVLDTFAFLLTIEERQLKNVVEGVAAQECFPLFRSLKVKTSFELGLIFDLDFDLHDDLDEDCDEEDRYDFEDDLKDKYEPLLRDMMLPDSLRPSGPPTQKERYLERRKG